MSQIEGAPGSLPRLADEQTNALVLTEGLLVYLSAEEVGALAEDLALPESFRRWIVDIVSPGLLRMLPASGRRGA